MSDAPDVAEIMARAGWRAANPPEWEGTPDADLDWSINSDTFRKQMRAALAALHEAGFKVLARDPDRPMLEGLAKANGLDPEAAPNLADVLCLSARLDGYRQLWDAAPRHGGEG